MGADDHTIDAVMAAIAVKALGGQSEELAPGLAETVWAHKAIYARDAVQLLATRRGSRIDPRPRRTRLLRRCFPRRA